MSLAEEFMQAWKADSKDNYFAHPELVAEDDLGLKQVQHEIVDEWRWGNHLRAVYTNGEKYIAVTWRDSSGDERLSGDEMGVEATDVTPRTVTTTVYE